MSGGVPSCNKMALVRALINKLSLDQNELKFIATFQIFFFFKIAIKANPLPIKIPP